MQMRAGSPAGGSDQAKIVSLLHALAAAHIDAAQVGVHRRSIAAVLDHHHIAVTTLYAGKFHYAIRHRTYRSASCSAVIHAQVRAPGLQNRVESHREPAGNARESNRRG